MTTLAIDAVTVRRLVLIASGHDRGEMIPNARGGAQLRLVDPVEADRSSPDPSHSRNPPTPRPTPDDAQLLAAIREGDPTAASALYDRARPIVDRTIRRLIGRDDRDHDDLAQLSLIEIIHSIERYRGDCALDGWLSTVTAHTVFKQLRKRKSESRVFSSEEAPEIAGRIELNADRRGALRSVVERVRKHLDGLEKSKAWTFLLHEVCGYDLREIAEITEVSVAAAQQRLSRGRRELTARFREDQELLEEMSDLGLEGRP
jgi:RNA polymerase sigma-70 factor (ECF subfamily)